MRIALIGYGKMGQAIEKIALERGHEIVFRIRRNNSSLLANCTPSTADVAIDFTQPDCAYHYIDSCLKKGLPIISGTTGWLKQKPALEQYCLAHHGTFFYAPSFSLLGHVFLKMNTILAQLMAFFPDYKVSIEETHHINKKDKPSGTALHMVADICQHIPALQGWSPADSPSSHTVPISVYRLPESVGTHLISYTSSIEALTLQHTSNDRASFAYGVVQVAEWIQGKKGVFTMEDFFKDNFNLPN